MIIKKYIFQFIFILFLIISIISIITSIYSYNFPKELVITLDDIEKNDTFANKGNYQKIIQNLQENYGNKDIIGHLKINGTDIDTPIVQTTNNTYYLKHNLSKSYSRLGTPFIDYRNTNSDKQINIYGHNSELIKMPFYDLSKYLNKDFYNNNQLIELVLNNKKNIYQIFSVYKENNNLDYYEHMKLEFNDQEWLKHLNNLNNKSIYKNSIEFTRKDHIIILQTCLKNGNQKKYLLICAKLIE